MVQALIKPGSTTTAMPLCGGAIGPRRMRPGRVRLRHQAHTIRPQQRICNGILTRQPRGGCDYSGLRVFVAPSRAHLSQRPSRPPVSSSPRQPRIVRHSLRLTWFLVPVPGQLPNFETWFRLLPSTPCHYRGVTGRPWRRPIPTSRQSLLRCRLLFDPRRNHSGQ